MRNINVALYFYGHRVMILLEVMRVIRVHTSMCGPYVSIPMHV